MEKSKIDAARKIEKWWIKHRRPISLSSEEVNVIEILSFIKSWTSEYKKIYFQNGYQIHTRFSDAMTKIERELYSEKPTIDDTTSKEKLEDESARYIKNMYVVHFIPLYDFNKSTSCLFEKYNSYWNLLDPLHHSHITNDISCYFCLMISS